MQRKITYAGQSECFDSAVKTLKELSNLDINKTAIRKISLEHGNNADKYLSNIPASDKAEYIMSQTDGSMVPITIIDDGDMIDYSNDKRKNKKRIFKEIRLNYSQNNKEEFTYTADFVYKEDIKPFIDKSLRNLGYRKGSTKIYAIGDGAPWIYNVYNKIDKSSHYTIDYYHLKEKISPMASYFVETTAWDDLNKLIEDNWTDAFGKRIINGEIEEVYNEILKHKRCGYEFKEYVSSRLDQFDYPTLTNLNLPIGSGIIEGGHKSIIQKRVSKSGSGWKMPNVKNIINLRLLNANKLWDKYWEYKRTQLQLAC